jgi:Protein of unknown function (DUF1592)/Protein of unknown function (DUF1595)/Protein of unknown function (DUF1588)/Protein of unknown function (DUF1585)/Protein of unknown function (DUF1587)
LVRRGLIILLLSILGLACGKTSQDAPAAEAHAAGSNAGGARPVPDDTAGSNLGGAAGTGELSHVDLTGAPIYTRVQRLTNSQWENAVTDILRFPQRHGLSTGFSPPPSGLTPFDNNEQVLFVDQGRFNEFEAGAESAAAIATGSPEALAALYAGDDEAGFVRVFGRRAFRRPLTADEETKYQGVFALGESLYGAGFANGAALVIRAMLESPHFLYRTELGPAGDPLSPYELASKLSFWLLGTTPSDALLDAAAAGTFASNDQLVAAARKMLEDPRAVPVMRDFHGQLLHVASFDSVSKSGAPEYDSSINPELTLAANAFFDFIFRQNLGLRELLTSTKAYLGPRLAPFYGVDVPAGLELRDVGPSRSGYFMQVPFLMVSSQDSESNPTLRGSQLELAMLCGPLGSIESPPLPPLVPGQTNRQRVTQLTEGCGEACHRSINPLGFAFESFDGLGREREMDNGSPVDTSGSFPLAEGVESFVDGNALMTVLAGSAQVHTCYSKQVTGYALGRDLVEGDRPLLEALGKVGGAQSLKELVVALVQDPAFRTRKAGMP